MTLNDLDLSAIVGGSDPGASAQLEAMRKMGLVGQLSGDRVLAALGGQVTGMADRDSARQAQAAQFAFEQAGDRRKEASADAYRQQQLGLEKLKLAQGASQAARELDLRQRQMDQDMWSAQADPVSGGVVMYNKKSGESRPLGPGGGSPTGPAGIKLTDSQAKAFSAVNRLRLARQQMSAAGTPSGISGRWDAAATGTTQGPMSRLVPSEAATEQGRQYFTAARNLIAALLRKESGAAITKDEWEQLGPLYIPMPYDDPVTVQNKTRMLDAMENSAITESGPAGANLLNSTDNKTATPAEPSASVTTGVPSPDELDALRKKYGL